MIPGSGLNCALLQFKFVHRLTRLGVTPPPGGKFAPGKGLKHVGIIASEAASAIAKGLNNTGFTARGACKWHQCHHLRRSLVSLVAPWHLLTIPPECSAWQWHASTGASAGTDILR